MYFGHSNRGFTGSSAGGSGFNGQTGYSMSGVAAWDSDVTISNGSNPFSANSSSAPNLVMFDDFRGGTPGVQMVNNQSGVLGSSAWLNQVAHGLPYYQSGNRSGTGNCIRLRNNGDGDITYACALLEFASTTGLFIFFAENSHGTDYNSLTSNGGNNWNYKMHWFMQNQWTGGAFEEWIPAVHYSSPGTAQAIGGNDSSPGPLPTITAGDGTMYDANDWSSCEVAYVGNPSNPTGAAGIAMYGAYTARNGGLHELLNTSTVLFSSSTGAHGDFASGNTLTCPGLIEGCPTSLVIDRTDYYIATGASALCRWYIGNNSTIGLCTKVMPCTVNSWAAGAVSIRLRQGPFVSPSGNYLFWFDAANNCTLAGQFQ